MDIIQTYELAERLFVQHGLDGWTFRVQDYHGKCAVCLSDMKKMEVSYDAIRDESTDVVEAMILRLIDQVKEERKKLSSTLLMTRF